MNEPKPKKCDSCGREMFYARRIPFRIGGKRGDSLGIFRELAEIQESLLPLDVYICSECGHVKLFADKRIAQGLLAKKGEFLKKCAGCEKEIPIAQEKCQYCGAEQPEYFSL